MHPDLPFLLGIPLITFTQPMLQAKRNFQGSPKFLYLCCALHLAYFPISNCHTPGVRPCAPLNATSSILPCVMWALSLETSWYFDSFFWFFYSMFYFVMQVYVRRHTHVLMNHLNYLSLYPLLEENAL